jgi:hypothetical protein
VSSVKRLILCLFVLAVAGCGGSGAPPTPAGVYPDDPQVVARATTAKQRRDLVTLWTDTKALRRAAAQSKSSSLKGDVRVRRATSRFIDDLDKSAIDDLSKNRAIDHAAAAAAPVCGQCFQQLEAIRPIPAIAH